jgi:hypothetical protein
MEIQFKRKRLYRLDEGTLGSGGGWRAILDGRQGRIVHERDLELGEHGPVFDPKVELRKLVSRKRGNVWNDRVLANCPMRPAETGLGFCRILHRNQIVGNRDDREKYQQEQEQSGHLGSVVQGIFWGMAKPQAHNRDCQKSPNEIQHQFHCLARFYNMEVSEGFTAL